MVGSSVFLSGDCGRVSKGVDSLVSGGVESNSGYGDGGFFTEGDGREGEWVGDGERGDD